MSDPPGGQPRRARNLLSSYYGASVASSGPEVDDLNIDGAGFNVDKYVSGLLEHKSLPELMQRGIAMVSEIKSLDSDMQMLVYEMPARSVATSSFSARSLRPNATTTAVDDRTVVALRDALRAVASLHFHWATDVKHKGLEQRQSYHQRHRRPQHPRSHLRNGRWL